MLYTLNLYTAVRQLHLNKTGRKKVISLIALFSVNPAFSSKESTCPSGTFGAGGYGGGDILPLFLKGRTGHTQT